MLGGLIAYARGNAVAFLALFVALGGVGVAATNPLRDKPGAVKSSHIADGAVRERHLDPTLGVQKAIPPSDGEFTGDWSAGQLKLQYKNQQVQQVIYVQYPIGGPACEALFVNPEGKTVGNDQYLTGTSSPGNQTLQLHVRFENANSVTALQGAVTQSADPTSCGIPAGLDLDK